MGFTTSLLIKPKNSQETPPLIVPQFSEETSFTLAQDPVPDEAINRTTTRSDPPKTRSAPRGSTPTKVRKEVEEEIEVYLGLAAATWSLRDPQCALVLSDHTKAIANSVTDLLARNPRLLEKFHATGVIGDWVKLGMAIMPVLKAIASHHVMPDKKDETDDGDFLASYPAFVPSPAR